MTKVACLCVGLALPVALACNATSSGPDRPPPTRPVISVFTAEPTSIASGGSSTLSWTIAGATSASIDGTPIDASGGTRTVTPAQTTTYTLSASNADGTVTATATVRVGSSPSTGWLYTKAGSNRIYVDDGAGERVWMGRGTNVDDLFLGCYNDTLWMATADAEAAMYDSIASLVTGWRASFVRIGMGMASCNKVVSWLTNPAEYRDPMVRVIERLTRDFPSLYVLLTLRTDASMSCDDEATCIPTTSTNAVYRAMVDAFATNSHVAFGLSNEPGGWSWSDSGAQLAGIMSGAVDAIRAEEDRLGVPHHLVLVQSIGYTCRLVYYGEHQLQQENVAYEYHNYPPETSGVCTYVYGSIPVVVGEYAGVGFAPLTEAQAAPIYADWEARHIPSLAWYFSPYSPVYAPLVQTTHDGKDIRPTAWGLVVRNYLTAHP